MTLGLHIQTVALRLVSLSSLCVGLMYDCCDSTPRTAHVNPVDAQNFLRTTVQSFNFSICLCQI